MSTLKYKGYIGSIEANVSDGCLYGEVLFLSDNALISYEGETVQELQKDFEEAVDSYIETCKANGIEPKKSFTGSMNIRISPASHAKVAEVSASEGMTINAFIREAIEEKLSHSLS